MARALDQIISELDSVYRPQRDLYNQQLSQQDPQMEAEQKGLMAQKEDSFRQITDQANRRGMFYSGLPIAEEQRYTGQQFLPAMANLAGKYKASKDNLSETLARLGIEQRDKAYGVYQQELAIDEQMRREAEQRRQFDEQQRTARAAAGSGGYSFGSGGGGGGSYGYQQKANKGFAFVDADGNPISAATYAKATNTPFRDLLQMMANKGDTGALQGLQFMGNIGEGTTLYDTSKINQIAPYKISNRDIYNSLAWGMPQ